MLPVKRYTKQAVRLPMTALIDIVFLLLIYFLLTTNFLVSDILPLALPQAETSKPQETRAVHISIDAGGGVYLGGAAVAMDNLKPQFCAHLTKNSSLPVILRSDSKVDLARVVTVLDTVRACGGSEISLATDRKSAVP